MISLSFLSAGKYRLVARGLVFFSFFLCCHVCECLLNGSAAASRGTGLESVTSAHCSLDLSWNNTRPSSETMVL